MTTLEIRGLRASAGNVEILHGIDLTVSSGEVHAVMGPNGAGKSTLSSVLMGKPGYTVLGGTATLDGVDLLALAPYERALAGLHLVMQYPTEVPGVALLDALREALRARNRDVATLGDVIHAESVRIGFDEQLLLRSLNVDLSGGEKKRNETLQLAVLQPRIAILDELDSGLDIDALRDCARRVNAAARDERPPLGVMAITHYTRLLDELPPDRVHILVKGRIVDSGGPELAAELERTGYAAFAANDQTPSSSALDDLFAPPR
jgi:Fe-S cluster assembly ATP-binding protein